MHTIKRFSKMVVAALLAVLARAVVRRYRPRIVMVTGSVGKTSTKDAVAAALSARFFVRKSEKSYNSEIGVPLTIFGARNPWGDPFGWLGVVKTALALVLLPNHYPNMLVLEVGADRPGDLAHVLRIATPDAVVVTRLPEIPVHVEAYESPEAVREEEFSPAYALTPAAPLIVPADDPYAPAMARRTAARVFSYGEAEGADVRVYRSDFHREGAVVDGMEALVTTHAGEGTVIVRGSVGRTQVLPAAAAIATALAFDITLEDALAALASYEPPAGRGRLLAGLHDSTLIDDSYNSSPTAVEEALGTLTRVPGAQRRVAVLGDMLELGRYSVAEHERIGALAARVADVVIAVGIRARAFASAARAAGMPEARILQYDDSRAAAEALPALVERGDVLLVKGSQSVRMERVVDALLASVHDRARLVRQERAWQRR
jgi:UDP-N-acetylmuramoyl-tripeptide--D-alanyl-D-alanine ligase